MGASARVQTGMVADWRGAAKSIAGKREKFFIEAFI